MKDVSGAMNFWDDLVVALVARREIEAPRHRARVIHMRMTIIMMIITLSFREIIRVIDLLV